MTVYVCKDMIRYRTTWANTCQIVIGLLIFFLGCTPGKEPETGLSAYYFPIETFPPEGATYIFQNRLDSLADPEIWKYRKTGPGRMVSINMDAEGNELLYQYDRVVPNGIVTDSLILLFQDSLGQKQKLPVKVISPNRFPFDAVDSSKVWLTHLDWYQPEDSLHVVLERRRRFMGYTEWVKDGKAVPAVRFRTEDKFETERDGWTTSMWSGEEIYAKGIGLVYYKRHISDQMVLEFGLVQQK